MKTKRNQGRKTLRKDCAARPSPKRRISARKRAARPGARRMIAASPASRLPSSRVPSKVSPPVARPATESPAPTESLPYTGDSAFHLYLREVGQTPLLTPKEEVQLARRIHRGDAKAREHMIKANLRLVVKIARDYENFGLPLLDLIN